MAGKKHPRLNILIDRELQAALEQFAVERDLSIAGAARFALREYLRVSHGTHDAVFREVRAEMMGRVRAALETALAEIPPADVPSRKRR